MSLENYTGNISDLVATNPTGTDPRSQGDDHLRGIKYTLKQSFPLATGPVRVSGDKLFAGDSADNTKNFVIDAGADDGTMKLARESGQDIMTVDAAGRVDFKVGIFGIEVVFSQYSYAKFPAWMGGLLIQWGYLDVNTGTNIVLPKSYFDTTYAIVASALNSTGSTNSTISTAYPVASTQTTSGFNLACTNGTRSVRWLTIGKGAA